MVYPQDSRRIHSIDLPKKIVVGEGVLSRVGEFARSINPNAKEALVVTGPHVRKLYYERLKASFESSGIKPWDMVVTDSSTDTARKVSSRADRDEVTFIVGFGGGRSIDVAKYAAYKIGKGFISVPTVASHDGITSPFASLKGFDRPTSRRAKPPDLIVLDVDVIASAPKRYNIAGFADLVGKYTAVLDWRLAHKLKGEYYGEYAASLALMSARHVGQYVNEIAAGTREGYRVLLEALVSSGVAMCIAGSTRPASGSEHLFAHALAMVSSKAPLHGEAVGVGTIMMAYLHGRDWRKIKRILKTVGAPTTAEELGVSREEVVKALSIAPLIRPERYTILGEKEIELSVAEKIAMATGVIA